MVTEAMQLLLHTREENGAVQSSFNRRFNDPAVLFYRYTGEHSEEDHGQAVPSACGGQAAQHGFGV